MRKSIPYWLRRVLQIVPTTVGVLLLTFVIFYVVGDSPAQIALGKNASAQALADFDARYGYDKPLFCGNWSALRAYSDWSADRSGGTSPAFSNGVVSVAFAYPLPSANYRLTWRTTSGTYSTRLSGSTTSHTFASDAPPIEVRLRRKTAHFFDSQFVFFAGSLLRGDWGDSTEQGRPVLDILAEGIGPSLSLTIPILLIGTTLSLLCAMVCAVARGGWLDRTFLVVSTVLMSVNYVVWVIAGQYLLAFRARLFPLWGYEGIAYLVLPVLIGVVCGLGREMRLYRTLLLDEVNRPYVRTAYAKGLTKSAVMVRHVLRNCLVPVLTNVSLSIPFLFTGSLLLESFFGIPGLGSAAINAINASDIAVIRAIVILGALLYQFVVLTTDLLYPLLDPRIKLR